MFQKQSSQVICTNTLHHRQHKLRFILKRNNCTLCMLTPCIAYTKTAEPPTAILVPSIIHSIDVSLWYMSRSQ